MMKRLFNFINPLRASKPQIKPSDYSATLGIGSVVPVQIEAYFLALNRYVREDARVLDVGFGLGYGLNILAIKALNVWGIDIDDKALDYCRNTVVGRNPRLTYLTKYDGYNIPFSDSYFDVVTCVDVLEHVEDYNILLNEMLRVTKSGVFISTPNRRIEYTNIDGTPKNYYHLREWNFEELNDIITKFGPIEWNFINGPFDGPFSISNIITEDTMALTPFIKKKPS